MNCFYADHCRLETDSPGGPCCLAAILGVVDKEACEVLTLCLLRHIISAI